MSYFALTEHLYYKKNIRELKANPAIGGTNFQNSKNQIKINYPNNKNLRGHPRGSTNPTVRIRKPTRITQTQTAVTDVNNEWESIGAQFI